MATEKKFFYNVRQNQTRDSKMFGKWYPEAKILQTLSTRSLAKHIMRHGSSNAVKIDGLGTFTPVIEAVKGGSEDKEGCDATKIQGIHIRLTPEGSDISGENITSRAMLKRVNLERAGWVTGTHKTKNYAEHAFMNETVTP